MENIFFIGAAGFILLSVYNYRIRKIYIEINSNKFLICVLVWGMFPFAIYRIIREMVKQCNHIANLFYEHKNLILVADAGLISLCAFFCGLILSSEKFQQLWNYLKEKTIKDSTIPKTLGIVEYDWHRFSFDGKLLIFTLKNNKVYVGILVFADYLDTLPEGQRSVRIVPLKSGHRRENGDVEYRTYYMPTKLNIDDNGQNSDDSAKEIKKYFDEVPPLVIFQREIVSYTLYDEQLNEQFGHEKNA